MFTTQTSADPVTVVTGDARLAAALVPLVAQAGVRADHVVDPAAAGGLIVLGSDISPEAAAAAGIEPTGPSVFRAAFGDSADTAPPPDGAMDGPCQYLLPADAVDLVAAVEAAAHPRAVRRLGVVGAHGGAGATSLAVALTRHLARGRGAARLIDLDPGGAPVRAVLGSPSEPPAWSDLLIGGLGELMEWTDRAGFGLVAGLAAAEANVPAWRLRAGIELAETVDPAAVTVLDAAAAGPVPLARLARWCDAIVVVTRAHRAGVAATARVVAELAPRCRTVVAARRAKGGVPLAEVAAAAPGLELVEIDGERGLVAGAAHGVAPGDRHRGGLRRAAANLAHGLLGGAVTPARLDRPAAGNAQPTPTGPRRPGRTRRPAARADRTDRAASSSVTWPAPPAPMEAFAVDTAKPPKPPRGPAPKGGRLGDWEDAWDDGWAASW